MSGGASREDSLVARWERLWFTPVPSHSFALLRIVFGLLVLVSLLGLIPVSMFWSIDGLAPVPGAGGMRAVVLNMGWGTAAGWLVFMALLASSAAMAIGWHSGLAVLASFVGALLQPRWNHLPLSSASQVMTVVLFCLMWADTSPLWSIDARRAGRPGSPPAPSWQPVWPLYLIRCQVAVIYGASGLWKLFGPTWRDGSAVHYALNLNVFHRFPYPVPDAASGLLTVATYATLAWELSFPLLVLFRRTRSLALLAGVALHLGLWATLELGPFSWLMIATYIAFLDPSGVAAFMDGLGERVRLRGRALAAAGSER